MTFPEKCTGCRACEIACFFHHKKVFGRKLTSIQVKRFERKGKFEIVIYQKAEGKHQPCDLCAGEKEPLCVKFCSTEALVRG
ncbi:4Fe-4S binding protein [Candidatus Bathyarchaeota archaeon]|nr:4Fe-4S binding protein [Candidatus Bathyarchaeota archaeon]